MGVGLSWWGVLALLCASFVAGTVDAIVGGGGLIQLPALLIGLPNQPTATLLGTNKIASFPGTASASYLYTRKTTVDRNSTLLGMICAFAGAALGAALASHISSSQLKPLVLLALVGVFAYVLRTPDIGTKTFDFRDSRRKLWLLALIGAGIGFYDGLIGPGTGSFLVFALVGLVRLDFLHASAVAKLLNATTNLAAIITFAFGGHILFGLGIAMGTCNAIGAQIGARTAIRKGTTWIRKVFLLVVAALIARLGYDVFAA